MSDPMPSVDGLKLFWRMSSAEPHMLQQPKQRRCLVPSCARKTMLVPFLMLSWPSALSAGIVARERHETFFKILPGWCDNFLTPPVPAGSFVLHGRFLCGVTDCVARLAFLWPRTGSDFSLRQTDALYEGSQQICFPLLGIPFVKVQAHLFYCS